jgi:hypothetical protein
VNGFFKIIASALLLFNGIGAIYGGWNLIIHPDGSSLQMTPGYLQYSPFNNYLIPGIILFIANGLGSFVVIATLLFNYRKYPFLIILQGSILTGWIVIQMILVRSIFPLHIVLGAVGLLLILSGVVLLQNNNPHIER